MHSLPRTIATGLFQPSDARRATTIRVSLYRLPRRRLFITFIAPTRLAPDNILRVARRANDCGRRHRVEKLNLHFARTRVVIVASVAVAQQ